MLYKGLPKANAISYFKEFLAGPEVNAGRRHLIIVAFANKADHEKAKEAVFPG